MTTALIRPHASVEIGPFDDAVIVLPEQVVYAEGFEASVGGWAFASPSTSISRAAAAGGGGAPRTGAYMLSVSQASPFNSKAVRVVTGLDVGRTYTLRAWAGRRSTGKSARVGVTGRGFGASVTGWAADTFSWKECSHTFVATATAHELILEGTTSGGTGLANPDYWDDISLTGHAVETTTPEVPVTEGSVTLDAMGVPYASAQLTIPLTDPTLAEGIDPRDEQRAVLTAGNRLTNSSRAFDLGVRRRRVDHKTKTIDLELASDEALLQDYSPLIDIDLWDYSSSLRAVVNVVLSTCIPGAALEASPSPDADVTPRWQQTNLIANPRSLVNTDGWSTDVSGGVAGSITRSTTSIVREGASLASWTRLGITTTGIGNATLRYGSTQANSPRVTPGRLYTFSAWVHQDSGVAKTGRVLLVFRNAAYAALPGAQTTAVVQSSDWTKISVTVVAPPNAEYAVMTAGVTNGMASGKAVGVSGAVLAEGVRNDRWFDGGRANEGTYTYGWTPDANTTPSVRVPVGGEIDPDSLLWPVGVTAWEFLEPLTAGAGLRLFCDEQRKWRLIDPAEYTAPGVLSLSPAVSTEGADEINLNDPEVYCTGVVVRYSWTDQQGVRRTRNDTAGTPGLQLVLDLNRPWPGAGVAAAILMRRTGQGRVQDVTALARWSATPAQQATVSLPGTLDQLGQVEAIEWGLSNGLMVVKTRALTDIVPGSWLAEPGTWADADPLLTWEDA